MENLRLNDEEEELEIQFEERECKEGQQPLYLVMRFLTNCLTCKKMMKDEMGDI